MTEKPLSADPDQREHQTRVSREQSGLPPEPPEAPAPKRPPREERSDGGKTSDE
jgi:hypothetical protein